MSAGPAAAGPVSEVVVGAVAPGATVSFLETFGLIATDEVPLGSEESHALFGIAAPPEPAIRMASARRRDSATVLVVSTDHSGSARSGWSLGPRALDIYSTNLDESLELAHVGGHGISPVGELAGGPMRMRQAMVHGPGGLSVVLVDTTHRRSSVCDDEAAPLHSEPHSVVWVVADHADEVARWAAAGWTAGTTIHFAEPTISDELGLDERPTPITMTMLSDPGVAPVRLELMTFDDHSSAGSGSGSRSGGADLVLRSGLAAVTIETGPAADSVADCVAAWGSGAVFGPIVPTLDGRLTCAGRTVGGVSLILRQSS